MRGVVPVGVVFVALGFIGRCVSVVAGGCAPLLAHHVLCMLSEDVFECMLLQLHGVSIAAIRSTASHM